MRRFLQPIRLPVFCVAVGVFVAGCGGESSPSIDVAVDTLESGRIEVMSLGDAPVTAPVRLRHVATVGSLGGDSTSNFGRVVDAMVHADGQLYVLDAQARAVRVFSLDGSFTRTLARSGNGPGELAGPYAIAGDSEGRLWIADAGNRRFEVFEDGALSATRAAPYRGGLGRGMVRISSDRLWDMMMLSERTAGEGGAVRIRSLGMGGVGFRLGDPLLPTDTVPLGPWRPEGLTRSLGSETLTQLPPLGPQRVSAFGPDGVWTGVTDQYLIHKVAPPGDTVLTVGRPTLEPAPLSAEDAARIDDWYAATTAEGFEGNRSILPKTYPFFRALSVDEVGRLWVFRNGAVEGTTLIDLYEATGRYGGTTTVAGPIDLGPAGLNPRISNGYLVLSSSDEFGVQYVQVFEVVESD